MNFDSVNLSRRTPIYLYKVTYTGPGDKHPCMVFIVGAWNVDDARSQLGIRSEADLEWNVASLEQDVIFARVRGTVRVL